jgi:uncharacterized membrane protein SpoIIM required for sporulation
MGRVFDFLYALSVSIVQHDGTTETTCRRRRAHRAVIIMSYMLGLLLSSLLVYLLSLLLGAPNVNAPLFATAFVVGMCAPYFRAFQVYIKKERFAYVVLEDNIPKSWFLFGFS